MKHDAIQTNTVAIEGRHLAKALRPILRVIEKRTAYPILCMVRLAVTGSSLTLVGTDLDIEISHRLDVNDAKGEWSACVDPRILAKIARQAGPALVTITLTAEFRDGLKPDVMPQVLVEIGDDTEYRLTCMSDDAFPALPGKRRDLLERFTNGRLTVLLSKVAPFISREETRYYLNGVCWQLRENGLRFVATDGHRLGVCRYAAGDIDTHPDMIIPRKAVSLLLFTLGGADVEVFSVPRSGGITTLDFVSGPITIRTKLIEGTFPDVDRVTPKTEGTTYITATRHELLSAIDAAAVMRQRNSTALRFFEKDDVMHIESKSPDHGDARARTRVSWPGGCSDFGLNATYIRDMVDGCEGDVVIHVKDAESPFLVKDSDEAMTRVIMPMRV